MNATEVFNKVKIDAEPVIPHMISVVITAEPKGPSPIEIPNNACFNAALIDQIA